MRAVEAAAAVSVGGDDDAATTAAVSLAVVVPQRSWIDESYEIDRLSRHLNKL